MDDQSSSLRAWSDILARYREPNNARSMIEIVITVVPLVLLWLLMWASLDIGYWLCLLLSVPAAGFLVRLFMIQHDCGHGAFFRQRAVNDWVGRVIGVLTLTPYDYLAAHARHPPCGLRQSRSARHRRHRHADGARISGAVPMAAAALSAVPQSAGDVRHRSGVQLRLAATAAAGIDAQWLAALGQHDGDECRHRARCRAADLAGRASARSCWCTCPSRFSGRRSASGCSTSSTSSKTRSGSRMRAGIFTRRRCMAARIMTCRACCAGSPPISACITSTICAAESRITGCRGCCGITRNLPPSDVLRCWKASEMRAHGAVERRAAAGHFISRNARHGS